MRAPADLITDLFTALDRHDHTAMAACYADDATFSDIAFDLTGKRRIHAMWHMICDGDIKTKFEIVEASDTGAVVNAIDDYTFRATGRRVHNVIQSRFRVLNGAIVDQHDSCDASKWAAMALGGVSGFLAGRLTSLRQRKARKTLDAFIASHPEYQQH